MYPKVGYNWTLPFTSVNKCYIWATRLLFENWDSHPFTFGQYRWIPPVFDPPISLVAIKFQSPNLKNNHVDYMLKKIIKLLPRWQYNEGAPYYIIIVIFYRATSQMIFHRYLMLYYIIILIFYRATSQMIFHRYLMLYLNVH